VSDTRPIILCAGGTGGHLFPAEALAGVLSAQGFGVHLITDGRGLAYGRALPEGFVHVVPSATPSRRSVWTKVSAALVLARGTLLARGLLRRLGPAVVVGFGGYPTVPPVLAASQLRLPIVLHEQNAVIGRANRFLAARATAIATGFADLGGLDGPLSAKTVHTGNPVRPAVIEAAALPYPALGRTGGKIRVLVTGGSQGARVMSDVVPAALALLQPHERDRLAIVQQARPEDVDRVRQAYRDLGLEFEVESFFEDLPQRLAASHLMIGRAGASSVSECAVIGRPAIFVPLPGSLDQDQAANAERLARVGAAKIVIQKDFDPAWLAGELRARLDDPEGLRRAAEAAKTAGHADAASRLARLVRKVAGLSGAEKTNETAA
jgi:UDP-N-acetylglucosamine--N-acetylmuramyl-(pentapeptide) pyrophosphoryl-undecaprenol N-acetylglucosamine transferase